MFTSRRPCPAEQMHRCTGETRTAGYSHRLWGVLSWDRLDTEHRTPSTEHRAPNIEHRTSNIEKGLPASSTSSTHRPQNTSGFHNGRSNTGKGKGTHSDMGRKTHIHETRNMAPAASGANAPHPRPFASAPCVPHLKTHARTAHSAQRHSHRATPRARRLHAHASHFLCPERPSAPSALAPLPLVPCASPVPCGARNGSQIRVCARRSAAPGERGTGNGEWGTGP